MGDAEKEIAEARYMLVCVEYAKSCSGHLSWSYDEILRLYSALKILSSFGIEGKWLDNLSIFQVLTRRLRSDAMIDLFMQFRLYMDAASIPYLD